MKKRLIATIGAVLCASLALTSCGGGGTDKTETAKGGYGDSYPLKTDTVLTWYTPLESNTAQSVKQLEDTAFAKKFMELTGATVDFIHPSTDGSEAFNLMLASDELPDIIDHYWVDFPGGAEKAIDDGYIMDITDLVDKYAPNFKKLLKEHPEYEQYVKTDSGKIFAMPNICGVHSTGGLIIRQDWLDELGLEMPTTIDEWENVLTQFKEKKGATAPLSCDSYVFRTGGFTGAYGINLGWSVKDDKLVYGYYTDEYKDFLTLMNSWYKKGLFDKNFSTNDSKMIEANFLNGASGATYGGITSGISKYNLAMAESDPNFKAVAAPFPSLKKGEKSEYGQYAQDVSVFRSALSTNCKDPELAIRLLDFTYSDEGKMLFNYGIEGESYTMVDGKPVFTDKILKPKDGQSIGQALSYYAKPYQAYNSVQIPDAYEQTLTTPEMKEAVSIWGDTNAKEHVVPPLYPTSEEQTKLASIQNSIDTYAQEMLIKFIRGTEPLDKFDEYKKNLENMGVKELIELKNASYKRALSR